MESPKHTIEEIENALFRDGEALRDYFILDGSIVFWPKHADVTFCFYEGDEMAAACVEYLRSHGTAEYQSLEEIASARDAS